MGGGRRASSRSSSGVKCWSDNGAEELRCSSICGGAAATRGTKRLFNPFIRLPERIQPDTRHPPGRRSFPRPSPSKSAAAGRFLAPLQPCSFARAPPLPPDAYLSPLMTRSFGYRVLTASLLRDYWEKRAEVRPSGGDGFLPPLAKTKYLFFVVSK